MIKLENISTKRLTLISQRKAVNKQVYYYIYTFLKKNNIDNYQKLSELLKEEPKHYGNFEALSYLENQLNRVQEKVIEANNNDKEVKIYTFEKYNQTDLDKKTIYITDRENLGDVLLYKNPIYSTINPKNYEINKMSIGEIKEELSTITDQKLENAFDKRTNLKGKVTAEKVARAIDLYDDQVIRQANETADRGINLFELNKYEKKEIVRKEYLAIVEYLTDVASECIWGEITDAQRMRMLESTNLTTNRNLVIVKNEIIKFVSNYTTLTELQNGIVKKKTLDRLITKKR